MNAKKSQSPQGNDPEIPDVPAPPNPGQGKPFSEMMEEVKENNVTHGWYDTERTFSDDIALLHTEISEAFEAYRNHGVADMTPQDDGIQEGQTFVASVIHKPEGVGSELADVLIRLLDTAERYGVDVDLVRTEALASEELLAPAGQQQLGYDISSLHAILGDVWAVYHDFDASNFGWKGTLGLFLIRLERVAEAYAIDLSFEYERKMAYNRARPYRHGGKRL